jgi:hypothetical protein
MTAESTSTSPLVRDDGGMAPAERTRSYYGRGIINKPVWTWEIPVYFFTGGLAGACSLIATAARVDGNQSLARTARRIATAAALASPPLLISDLGRPERFHHMLRVIKPTSPMSMGSWLLAGFSTLQTGSTVLAELGRLPRLQRLAQTAAAALAPMMTTYTAVLISDTAVPVWHEARKHLPWLFASGTVASGGSACLLLVPDARAARRLAVAGGVGELALTRLMEERLGDLAGPYHKKPAGPWSKAATALTAIGAGLLAASGRCGRYRRASAAAGAVATFAGAFAERWAIFRAGEDSADDPAYTVTPQRERADTLTS